MPSRRLRVFLFSLVLVAVIAQRTSAQTPASIPPQGRLVGFTFPFQDPTSGLVQTIDPTTGVVNTVATLPSLCFDLVDIVPHPTALDPTTHRFFLVANTPNCGSPASLFTVNTVSNNPSDRVSKPIPLQGLAGNILLGFEFDPSTGKLLGFTFSPQDPTVGLVQAIDPTTGVVTKVATLPSLCFDNGDIGPHPTALDPTTHRFFLVARTPNCGNAASLLTVDTVSGSILSQVPLLGGNILLAFEFEPTTGKLLGFTFPLQNPTSGLLQAIDPTTGVVTTVATLPSLCFDEGALGSSPTALDPTTHRFFLVANTPNCSSAATLFTVNTVSDNPNDSILSKFLLPGGNILLGFEFEPGPACSVIPKERFYQSDPLPAVPNNFGFCPNADRTKCPTGPPWPDMGKIALCTTQKTGCALTATATMLTSFPFSVCATPPLLASATPSCLDAVLNTLPTPGYGIGCISGTYPSGVPCPGPKAPGAQEDRCEFEWARIPEVIYKAAQDAHVSDVVQIWESGTKIKKINESSDPSCVAAGIGSNPVDCFLLTHVCQHGDRVILRLNELVEGEKARTHFIYVIGESSAGPKDWNVFDPGWKSADPLPNLSTLSGHLSGFTPTGQAKRHFQVDEAIVFRDDPTLLPIKFSIKANSPVELLLADPQGNRLGSFQPGTDVFEIPSGSYLRDFPIADDTDSGADTGDPTGIKTAYVPVPEDGTYTLTVTGTDLGTYTLEFRAVATDGTVQDTTVVGLTNTGSVSTYQVAYSSVPGSPLTSMRTVTFQTTLDDISNSLRLDFIEGSRLADHLSDTIEHAAEESAEGEVRAARRSLKRFKREVNAQTPKNIKAFAAQVLLGDVDSLLAQLPKPIDDDE